MAREPRPGRKQVVGRGRPVGTAGRGPARAPHRSPTPRARPTSAPRASLPAPSPRPLRSVSWATRNIWLSQVLQACRSWPYLGLLPGSPVWGGAPQRRRDSRMLPRWHRCRLRTPYWHMSPAAIHDTRTRTVPAAQSAMWGAVVLLALGFCGWGSLHRIRWATFFGLQLATFALAMCIYYVLKARAAWRRGGGRGGGNSSAVGCGGGSCGGACGPSGGPGGGGARRERPPRLPPLSCRSVPLGSLRRKC